MPKYCPSCGAEVKEGFKFCLSCGAQLQTDTITQPQQPTQPPVAQQQTYTQPQPIAPMQPKKTNMKLIGGIIAIIVIVVVVALVAFMFIGGGFDSRFVGEWEYNVGLGQTMDLKFNNDGTVAMGTNGQYFSSTGNWNIEGDKLCISGGTGYGDKTCMKYTFSDNGNTLTIEDWPSVGTITFTKK